MIYFYMMLDLFKPCFLFVVFFSVYACTFLEPELCGNNTIDIGEECDGINLGTLTCGDAIGNLDETKYMGGLLTCTTTCTADTNMCDPCWGYPCAPDVGYGYSIGDIINDVSFEPANNKAVLFAGDNNVFDLSDLYLMSDAHNRGLTGVMFFMTTGWCPYCSLMANNLEIIYQEYAQRGIMLVGVVVQDELGVSATKEYTASYADKYGWTFPSVSGIFPFEFWPEFSTGTISYPFSMFVDITKMELLDKRVGLMPSNTIRESLSDVLLTVQGPQDSE